MSRIVKLCEENFYGISDFGIAKMNHNSPFHIRISIVTKLVC